MTSNNTPTEHDVDLDAPTPCVRRERVFGCGATPSAPLSVSNLYTPPGFAEATVAADDGFAAALYMAPEHITPRDPRGEGEG